MTGEELKAIVQAEWKRFAKPAVDPRTGPIWSPRTAPPLPSTWPFDGAIDFYAFADGFRPGLMDGVHIAAPWLRVRVPDGGAPVATLLSKGLVDVGIQGVRPVTPADLATLKQGGSLLEAIRQADAGVLKPYFASWISMNGRIADELRKLAPAFFAWLA